ncbi:Pyridine nucleotide-disulphide oxidoreductase domain protein [Synechococcus sp. PCC 7335]|uniref:NAD(P)/FAD-dependent oxidoreductase n=1 Tax=Synechococcus sp. (strain ATCC 29403 / PCC 7335) TaxID=91464 RepID=UPI00017EB55B|nr:FAD-dependent oxidoreductase [Synechococcus sp. PCC 7335]EDX83613.1 Pyridine nucleotide-disulphide oxidoreductase domain protein [Synechococcus sp. PCC 7335]
MANIVVVGAGLAGLPAAYELRYLLPKEHTVTLVSSEPNFTFIPGLVQVALNLKPLSHVQLDLARLAKRHHLNWMPGKVVKLDPKTRCLTVVGEPVEGEAGTDTEIEYDYLAIATGASLALDLVPGLGPHGGYTHSICTPDHALTARQAWVGFLENPGPIVIGAAPGAGCFGPAYEFALMADHELRRKGLRDQVSITYLTPEPYVGHLGVSNVKHARRLTAELMQERDITVVENVAITTVDEQAVHLRDGRIYPFKYSMILPAFRGAGFIREVPGLGDEKGFIPILPTQRHPDFPEIYAAGVSTQMAQPDQTQVPIGLPKSGQMAEAMATAVAHNIAVELGVIKDSLKVPTLEALCFAEFGETGIAYIAAPVLADLKTGKRKRSYAVRGPWVVWVKAAFEEYFMVKMRTGVGLPWFEKLGLRTLFGLKMLKSLSEPLSVTLPNRASVDQEKITVDTTHG